MITNPEVIRFSNEVIRPLAEKSRALVAEIHAATTTWYGGMNLKVTDAGVVIDDGREAEGASRLTGSDATNLMGVLIAMAAASNAEVINKPCVRPLRAE